MITVVAATHNGAHTLPRFLDSLKDQDITENWQILIVDNASTDSSAQIIKSYKDSLPITYLYEAEKGKNAALNASLSYLKGDIIIFTDDDVITSPTWLSSYRSAFEQNKTYSIFGGMIKPFWEETPNELHFQECIRGPVYALTDPNWEDGPCSPYHVWGPNMAIRSSVFEDGHTFNNKVGPNSKNKNYVMGSETSFTSGLNDLGYKCFHTRAPIVQHIIRANQMAPDWIFARGIRYGRSCYEPQEIDYNPKRIFGYPVYLSNRFLQKYSELILKTLFRNSTRFKARWDVNVLRGQLMESKYRHAIKK
jgi:glycosyltransferase involved in cell wall biosynthesis